jgi:hypothetical protein
LPACTDGGQITAARPQNPEFSYTAHFMGFSSANIAFLAKFTASDTVTLSLRISSRFSLTGTH